MKTILRIPMALFAVLMFAIIFAFSVSAAPNYQQLPADHPAIVQTLMPSVSPAQTVEYFAVPNSYENFAKSPVTVKKYGWRKTSQGFKTRIFYPPENLGRN